MTEELSHLSQVKQIAHYKPQTTLDLYTIRIVVNNGTSHIYVFLMYMYKTWNLESPEIQLVKMRYTIMISCKQGALEVSSSRIQFAQTKSDYQIKLREETRIVCPKYMSSQWTINYLTQLNQNR